MNCGCYSVNASDLTPVLIAFGAEIVTTKKAVAAQDLFTAMLKVSDALEPGELVTAIRVPVKPGFVSHYEKLRIRDSIDFALVSLASVYRMEKGRIAEAALVYGGVAPIPVPLEKVNRFLEGKAPTEEVAKQAAELAVEDAALLEKNKYKLSEARALVERCVLAMGAGISQA